MDTLRTCVMLVLLAPVSCEDVLFTEPITCYMLDGFLLTYCIIATMLYFRLKFFSVPCVTAEELDLQRPRDPDPYQDLEPVKRKKKDVKKKKAQKTPDKKPQQTLTLSSMNPPPSP